MNPDNAHYPAYDFDQSEDAHTVHTYIVEHNIHVMTVKKPTRRAAEEYINMLAHMYDTFPEGQRMLLLTDVGKGVPPVSYTFRIARTAYANIAFPDLKSAFLLPGTTLIALVRSFLELLRMGKVTRGYFHSSKHDEAMMWLLED